MTSIQKPHNYWTKEKCKEEALKYKTRSEFDKNNATSYNKARKYRWIDEICSHMVQLQKPTNYWTKEKCKEEALRYKTRNEFRKNNGSAYAISCSKGWIDGICSHMIQLQKSANYWTIKNVKMKH